MLLGHSGAIVGEGEDIEALIFGYQIEAYLGTTGVEGSVFDETADHAVDEVIVTLHFAVQGDIEIKGQRPGQATCRQIVVDLIYHLVEIDAVGSNHVGAIFEAGQSRDVVEKVGEAGGVFLRISLYAISFILCTFNQWLPQVRHLPSLFFAKVKRNTLRIFQRVWHR